MGDSYFVLRGTEDGVRVSQYTKQELEAYLNDPDIREDCRPIALSQVPYSLMETRENEVVIIKGEVVVPKQVQVVTKYDVP